MQNSSGAAAAGGNRKRTTTTTALGIVTALGLLLLVSSHRALSGVKTSQCPRTDAPNVDPDSRPFAIRGAGAGDADDTANTVIVPLPPVNASSDATAILSRIFVVWHSEHLPPPAKEVHEEWLRKVPRVPRHVVSLAKCHALALQHFPPAADAIERLVLNYHRHLVCKVLLLYLYGGVAMDLDVRITDPKGFIARMPPRTYGRSPAGIVVATNRHTGLVSHWFLAALPRELCLRDVLYEFVRLSTTTEVLTPQRTEEWKDVLMPPLHDLASCPRVTKVSDAYVRQTANHLQVSTAVDRSDWESRGYLGWRSELFLFFQFRDSVVPLRRVGVTQTSGLRPSDEEAAVIAASLRQERNLELKEYSFFRCEFHFNTSRDLAPSDQYPLAQAFANHRLPFSVMRDLCSVMGVFQDGGWYMDRRAQLRRTFAEWIPGRHAPFVFAADPFAAQAPDVAPAAATGPGGELEHDGPPLATWLFGAREKEPCLLRVIQEFRRRIEAAMSRGVAGAELAAQRALLTGPSVFTHVVQRQCGLASPFGPTDGGRALARGVQMTFPPRGAMAGPVVIPKVVHLVWKSHTLKDEALILHGDWLINEPALARNIVTDADCQTLADRFPLLGPRFKALPLNVMRADVCRLLAVYFHGGIYMDLDVAFVRPWDEWFNVSQDIVIGHETDDRKQFSNWFFAAKPRHPCFKQLLELVTERAGRAAELKESMRQYVHYITGPWVFTEGLRGCAKAELSASDVLVGKIEHKYASQQWLESSPSWVRQRDRHLLERWKYRFVATPLEDGSIPPGDAVKWEAMWTKTQTELERVALTDSKCVALIDELESQHGTGMLHPDAGPQGALGPWFTARYPTLPYDVRSGMCRVMAAAVMGGIFVDARTQKWPSSSVAAVMDPRPDIVLAMDDGSDFEWGLIGNHFFAARAGHRCMFRALGLMLARLNRTTPEALRGDYDLVRYIAGAFGFSDGMRECAVPTLEGKKTVAPNFGGLRWHRPADALRATDRVVPAKLWFVLPGETTASHDGAVAPTDAQARARLAVWRREEYEFDVTVLGLDECAAAVQRLPGLDANARDLVATTVATLRGRGKEVPDATERLDAWCAWATLLEEGGVVIGEVPLWQRSLREFLPMSRGITFTEHLDAVDRHLLPKTFRMAAPQHDCIVHGISDTFTSIKRKFRHAHNVLGMCAGA